jgi:pyruvate dehydrogenase E2 component (dihydrolipoamide acetyltransferase)
VRHVDLDAVVGTGPGGRIMRQDVETAPSATNVIATIDDEHITTRRPPTAPRASPYARRLATESGLDLLTLTGTGPSGAVVARDVRGAPVPTRIDERPAQRTDRAATMRQRIGEVMSRAHREIPQYHLTLTIDLDVALAALRDRNENHPPSDRILPAAALLRASAGALRAVPGFNGHYLDGAYRPADDVHLGVAVAMRGGGLIVPVLRNADRLDLATVMRSLHELVGRARAGRLRASDLADATATVTDLGDKSVDSVAGIIHPPQVALIGFGQIAIRPAVVNGQVVARPQVTATLTADHRVTDGHDGARLLQAIDQRLQQWENFDDT